MELRWKVASQRGCLCLQGFSSMLSGRSRSRRASNTSLPPAASLAALSSPITGHSSHSSHSGGSPFINTRGLEAVEEEEPEELGIRSGTASRRGSSTLADPPEHQRRLSVLGKLLTAWAGCTAQHS